MGQVLRAGFGSEVSWARTWRARKRELIMEVWGGAKQVRGSGGRSPLKMKDVIEIGSLK